jgi:hypothetical protein
MGTPSKSASDLASARKWIGLAVGSLLLAGLFSVLLVIARTPPLDRLAGDPLFFKRCLVVHVDLALVVFFHAFAAALWSLVPSKRPEGHLARLGPPIALAGVVAIVVAAGLPHAAPVLSNYVPFIDHPLFAAGMALVAVGLALGFAGGALSPAGESEEGALPYPPSSRVALRGSAVSFLVALTTFAAALAVTPAGLPAEGYWEAVAWGGGHVLQVAATLGMLAGWFLLVSEATGTDPLGRGPAAVLVAVLVLPLLAAPGLALAGTTTGLYRGGFTALMQWGIFPAVTLAFVLSVRATLRASRAAWSHPSTLAFLSSAALMVVGLVLGACIRGESTMVPAHYHTAIGAISVVYMALAFRVLAALGRPVPAGRPLRLAAFQPALFGAGQTIFAVGFALAGHDGMARKVYGAEQHARSATQTTGLAIMGLGGLVAVIAGVLFLWLVAKALLAPARKTAPAPIPRLEGERQWPKASIRSRS